MRSLDPELYLYIRGAIKGDPTRIPPTEDSIEELRRNLRLGLYTVVELDALLDEVEDCVAKWVKKNPPHTEG